MKQLLVLCVLVTMMFVSCKKQDDVYPSTPAFSDGENGSVEKKDLLGNQFGDRRSVECREEFGKTESSGNGLQFAQVTEWEVSTVQVCDLVKNGQPWLPTPSISYYVVCEFLTGSGTFGLYSETNYSGVKARDRNNDYTTTKKVIYFNHEKMRTDCKKVLFVVFPDVKSKVRLTWYVRYNGSYVSYPMQASCLMWSYIHNKQARGSTDCGPNSYMIARRLVDSKFSVGSSELEAIKTKLRRFSAYRSSNLASVTQLQVIASEEIGTRSFVKATTNKADFAEWISSCLFLVKPIVIPISLNTSTNTLTTSGGTGHFIVVVAIDKLTNDRDGTIVYYKDGLTDASTTKTVSLNLLLNSNMANSQFGVYSALTL